MTTITQRMREELVPRNYAEATISSYLRTVEEFRQHFQKRLDYMRPDASGAIKSTCSRRESSASAPSSDTSLRCGFSTSRRSSATT